MTAYRQSATSRTILFCPRCNELLDGIDFGVDMCPRCEGFWIGASVLALSGNQWPGGPQAWWRNELRCPACASDGVVANLNARTSAGVIVDQCFEHGVWLDRGELARVMMHDPVVQDLEKLRAHLAALAPTPVQLGERRERWRAEQDERARLADAERKRLEAERAKRAAEAAKSEQQRAAEQELERRRAQEEKLREAERLAEARRSAQAKADAERAAAAQRRIEEDRAAIAAAENARRHGVELGVPHPDDDPALVLARAHHQLYELELNRLVEIVRECRERLDETTAQVNHLHSELASRQAKLARDRADFEDAQKQLAEHRARKPIE